MPYYNDGKGVMRSIGFTTYYTYNYGSPNSWNINTNSFIYPAMNILSLDVGDYTFGKYLFHADQFVCSTATCQIPYSTTAYGPPVSILFTMHVNTTSLSGSNQWSRIKALSNVDFTVEVYGANNFNMVNYILIWDSTRF